MSPSLQTMGFFMSTINFCETKEQLNHLGEVVTGKTNGSPSGADIETSTLPYTGQVRKTLPALESEYDTSIATKQAEADAAIDEYRLLNKGPYTSGVTLESKFEYITYNGESYFAANPPYTTTATTPDVDGNLFAGGYTTIETVANKIGNPNLLSNSNFLTPSPDAITHPNATPESYVAGTQIFSGVYAGSSGVTVTLIDGRVNCSAGSYEYRVPNTNGLDRVPVFTSSVSSYDGNPVTAGVSHALVGDYYVVTVTPASGDVFSVKLEQGGVATRHEVKSLFDIYGHPNIGIYDPRAFGAVGDGVTNDTDSIDEFFTELTKNGGVASFPSEARYMVNKRLFYRSDNGKSIVINGNGATLDITASPTDDLTQGIGAINFYGTDSNNDATISIRNLTVESPRFNHQPSNDPASITRFGGLRCYYFDSISIKNCKTNYCSLTSGIGVGGYTVCKIDSISMDNVGMKYKPTADDNSGLDYGGDAIYTSEYKPNATTSISNITQTQWAGYLGRAGVVFETGLGNTHNCKLSNINLQGFNRTVHQEDGAQTSWTWDKGYVTNCSILFYNFDGYPEESNPPKIRSVTFENQSSVRYGGSIGIIVGFGTDQETNSPVILDNCEIENNTSGVWLINAVKLLDCKIEFPSGVYAFSSRSTTGLAKSKFVRCEIIFGSGVTLQTSNRSQFEFINCDLFGESSVEETIRSNKNQLKFSGCEFNDVGVYTENLLENLESYDDCIFNFTTVTGGLRVLRVFNSRNRKFIGCQFNNNSGQEVVIDDSVCNKTVVGCTFNNVGIECNAANDPREIENHSANTFNSTDGTLTEFIPYSIPAMLMSNCTFFTASGVTTTLPTQGNYVKFTGNYSISGLSAPVLMS